MPYNNTRAPTTGYNMLLTSLHHLVSGHEGDKMVGLQGQRKCKDNNVKCTINKALMTRHGWSLAIGWVTLVTTYKTYLWAHVLIYKMYERMMIWWWEETTWSKPSNAGLSGYYQTPMIRPLIHKIFAREI